MRQARQFDHRLAAIAFVCAIFVHLLGNTAIAHEGPPFPILMDEPLGAHRVSVWADPDIGEAIFYIVVETPSGEIPDNEPSVTLWVQPVSGRLARVELTGTRQSLRNRMQFEVKPYFDQRDEWTVGIRVGGIVNGANELVTQVESTPPGLGLWDFAIYLFPFVLLGGLWVMGLIRRRGQQTSLCETERSVERKPKNGIDEVSTSSQSLVPEPSSKVAEVRL